METSSRLKKPISSEQFRPLDGIRLDPKKERTKSNPLFRLLVKLKLANLSDTPPSYRWDRNEKVDVFEDAVKDAEGPVAIVLLGPGGSGKFFTALRLLRDLIL